MKFPIWAEQLTQIAQRAKPAWKMFALGSVVGATLGLHLTSHTFVIGFSVLLTGFLSATLCSVTRTLLLYFLVISGSSAALKMIMVMNGNDELPQATVLSVVLVLLCAGLYLFCRMHVERGWLDSLQAGVITLSILAFWLVISLPSRMNPVFYAYLLNEDNGTVFDVTARFLRDRSISESHFANSGWLTGTVQNLSALVSTVGSEASSSSIEVIGFVLRVYVLIAALSSVTSGLLIANAAAMRQSNNYLTFIWAGIGVVFGMPWIMGTIQPGHLAALVAILCAQLLLALTQLPTGDSSFAKRQIHSGLLLLVSLTLGGAWYPLQPLSIALAAGFFAKAISDLWRERNRVPRLVASILLVFSLLLLVLIVRYVLSFSYMGNIETVLSMFSLKGAVASIGQPMQFVILGGVIWVAVRARMPSLRWVIWTLLIYVALIHSVSYFLGESPAYGAAKTLFVLAAALFSELVREVAYCAKSTQHSRHRHLIASTAVGGLCLFIFSADPFSNFAFMVSNRPEAGNYEGLKKALQDPNRVTICLTTDPDYTDYEMYKCSRIALGAQGIHDSPYKSLMYGNLCQVQSKEMFAIPAESLERLRIIVSNPKRMTTGEGCGRRSWAGEGQDEDPRYLLGWTTAIPWGKVELIDLQGNQVTPSFDYLRSDGGYEEREIVALEEQLKAGE